jgi:hypothetical protein
MKATRLHSPDVALAGAGLPGEVEEAAEAEVGKSEVPTVKKAENDFKKLYRVKRPLADF